jgi:hypothetical protein
MQHVDGVADVEAFSLPSWRCGPWTHDDPGLAVVRLDGSDRIGWRLRRTRHIRYHATIRAAEAKLTIRLSIDLITLLVDGPVMAATEQHEVRERSRAALGPVADVVGLAEPPVAAREAATAVTMEQRPPQCRRNRAGLGPDLEDALVLIMLHHHPTRVTSQALGRFRGNACAIFDEGLAGLIGILEDDSVDMDYHLVVLGRPARIDAVVERGLGQQLQGVGLLLMGCTPEVRHGN